MNIIGNYIYGSEDSTDVDIAYIVDKLPSLQECKKFCSEDKKENRNLITINDGIITDCYKGTIDELNNAILDTYKLHIQNTELFINRNVKRDIPLKLIRSIRAMLSHLSRSQYRKEIKFALRSNWSMRLNTILNIKLDTIDFNTLNNNMSREDILKLFAFQIGQCSALIYGKHELYTKNEIISYNDILTSYLRRNINTNISELNEIKNKLIYDIINYFEICDINIDIVKFVRDNYNNEKINNYYDLKHECQINIENIDI